MTYSHPATKQDLWVLSRSNGVVGSAVELGAFDGLRHSNTRLLEEKGWHCTLIEGDYNLAQRCHQNRPNASVKHVVVAGKDGHETFISGGQYGGLVRTMPEEWLREHAKRDNRTSKVASVTLAKVIGTSFINYLSLDTEGSELEILTSWLMDGGRAGLLTIEFRYDTMLLSKIEEIAEYHGYALDEIRGFDACFIYNAHRDWASRR